MEWVGLHRRELRNAGLEREDENRPARRAIRMKGYSDRTMPNEDAGQPPIHALKSAAAGESCHDQIQGPERSAGRAGAYWGHGLDVAFVRPRPTAMFVYRLADDGPEAEGREGAYGRRRRVCRLPRDAREGESRPGRRVPAVAWPPPRHDRRRRRGGSPRRALREALRADARGRRRHGGGVRAVGDTRHRRPPQGQPIRAARQEAGGGRRHRRPAGAQGPRQVRPPVRRPGPDGARHAHDGQHAPHRRLGRAMGHRPRHPRTAGT